MMRAIFITVFAANLVLTVVSLAVLPDKVAIHFGPGGAPDSWAFKEVNAVISLAIEVPLFLILFYASWLTLNSPPRLLSLPNKDYWLTEANRPALKQKLQRLTDQFGIALYFFLLYVGLLMLQANLAKPVRLNEGAFVPGLVLFLGYSVVWCVGFFRSFRVPKEDEPPTEQRS